MKRQIKFRGKRVDTGEMVFGDLIHGVGSKHGRMYILPITNIYPKGCNELDGWEVAPDTVGQFTGLLDKNGKEIYEGDIIRVKTCEYDRIGRFYCKTGLPKYLNACVKYNDRSCRYDLVFEQNEYGMISCEIGWGYEEFEVIGNIYDNSELLKGGEQ